MRDGEHIVGRVIVPGIGRVCLSRHCVERYLERVKPALSFGQAVEDLQGLLSRCASLAERPGWIRPEQDEARQGEICRWLLLSDDIALPVVRSSNGRMDVIVTCLARGHIGEAARERRAQRRSWRSEIRRLDRQTGSRRERGRRPMHETGAWTAD